MEASCSESTFLFLRAVHGGVCGLRQELLLDQEHLLHSHGRADPHRDHKEGERGADLLPVGSPHPALPGQQL